MGELVVAADDVDEVLRKAGYDPEQVGREMRAFAEHCMRGGAWIPEIVEDETDDQTKT